MGFDALEIDLYRYAIVHFGVVLSKKEDVLSFSWASLNDSNELQEISSYQPIASLDDFSVYDLLSPFTFLFLRYDIHQKRYVSTLFERKRVGGYKEPFQNFEIATGYGKKLCVSIDDLMNQLEELNQQDQLMLERRKEKRK